MKVNDSSTIGARVDLCGCPVPTMGHCQAQPIPRGGFLSQDGVEWGLMAGRRSRGEARFLSQLSELDRSYSYNMVMKK